MKDVHFLLDEISEQDKKEVKDIIKKIKTRTQKTPKEVVFLRKFTLSLMKQYVIKKSILTPRPFQLTLKETHSIAPEPIILMPETVEVPEQIHIMPRLPSNDAPEPIRLPKITIKISVPEPLRIAELHQAAPFPAISRQAVPSPNKEVNAIKKELSVPTPN